MKPRLTILFALAYLAIAKSNAQPAEVAMNKWQTYSTTADSTWTSMYSHGVSEPINTTLYFNGALYAGADNLYKWDGVKWSVVAGGVNGRVYSLLAVSGSLYVCGQFTMAGSVAANYVARLTGDTWTTFGVGMNAPVTSICHDGTYLYAAGWFDSAGGVSANHIARWNGAYWAPLGVGTNDAVNALANSGTNIYVGGNFTSAGGLAANYIARWNGTSWSSLSTGVDAPINSIVVSGSNVYVAGYFDFAGGIAATAVAKWNGASWSSMGVPPYYWYAKTLAVSGSTLYASLVHTLMPDVPLTSVVVKYNGTLWSNLIQSADSVVTGSVNTIKVYGTDVYAAGAFYEFGDFQAINIVKCTGGMLQRIEKVLMGTVEALDIYNNQLYVAGYFPHFSSLAKFSGLGFQSPDSTGFYVYDFVPPAVYSTAVNGNKLYVAGYFSFVGSINANNIAMWDGTQWNTLGTGTNGRVYDIVVDGNNLYATGDFTTAGGVAASRIAKWDGVSWSALGSGLQHSYYTPWGSAISIDGGNVYVGGLFDQAGGVASKGIARWNGSSWHAMGTGINGAGTKVYVTEAIGGNVYISGTFDSVSGVPAKRVAVWNGSTWSPLAQSTTSPNITSGWALRAINGDLWAAGEFKLITGATIKTVGKWTGNGWQVKEPGVKIITSFVQWGNQMIVAGQFTVAGGHPAPNIAAYNYDIALPLMCNGFSYELVSGKIRLHWNIGGSSYGEKFLIKRSLNNAAFETITTISIDKDGSYSFVDSNAIGSNICYQLVLKKASGVEQQVCKTLWVRTAQTSKLQLWPNPTSSYLFLTHSNIIRSCKFFDVHGRVAKEVENAASSARLWVGDLPPGIYLLKCTLGNGEVVSERFIKQ